MQSNVTRLPKNGTAWRFAAIISGTDEPDILRHCIAHHLAIGVERVFISLNYLDDEASEAVIDEFAATNRVFAAKMSSFAANRRPTFLTAALERIRDDWDPDWVLIVDADEFWLPKSGQLADINGLEREDVFSVLRYNTPPVRTATGDLQWAIPITRSAPIFGDPQVNAQSFEIAPEANPAWIRTRIGPKVLFRPGLVSLVTAGAHSVIYAGSEQFGTPTNDVMILHLPFTTEARFRRKVSNIRETLDAVGHTLAPGQAAHWWRWLEVDAEGKLDAEFDQQVIDASDIAALEAAGVLTTPDRLFTPTPAELLV